MLLASQSAVVDDTLGEDASLQSSGGTGFLQHTPDLLALAVVPLTTFWFCVLVSFKLTLN